MTKTEYNKILDQRFKEILKPLGFKKTGIHYYLYDPPVIFFVRNGRSNDTEMLLCYSLDYFHQFKDKNEKFTVPKGILSYPVTIPAHVLRQQYKSHKTAFRFKYDLSFYTREMSFTRIMSSLDLGLFFNYFKTPKQCTTEYIDYSIAVIIDEGLKLKDEFDLSLAYWVLSKFPDKEYNYLAIRRLRDQIISHSKRKNLQLTKRQNSLLQRIQISFFYYKINYSEWEKRLKRKISNRKKIFIGALLILGSACMYTGVTMFIEYRRILKENEGTVIERDELSVHIIFLSFILFLMANEIRKMKAL